ncbi:hypothetical protein [Halostella sp. PRR32]|uniref:hypothetical protein n=1 Tax=Halostella sp. PRR32 TaxID=3098147 RepID=UPI002B1E8F0D|nr:hypothetical protein [Halostella sp. PRR32]
MSKSLYAALGNSSKYVTTETNVTGQLTPIATISPEDGLGLIIRNAVQMGAKTGLPIYAELADSNGDDLPLDTRVAIGYKRPTDDTFQVVSDPIDNISTYIKKTIQQQQDNDNIDAVKHALRGRSLEVRDIDEMLILVESSVQVDHSNSELYIEQSAVEQVDIE